MVISKKKKKVFEGNECENSFYIFKKTHRVRIYLYKMVTHTYFEGFILVLIVSSSLKLVADTYLYDYADGSQVKIVSGNVDTFFTIAFTCESVFKMLAFGVI